MAIRDQKKIKRRSKIFPNKELAKKFESQLELDIASKELTGESEYSPAFSEFAAQWIEQYCKLKRFVSTLVFGPQRSETNLLKGVESLLKSLLPKIEQSLKIFKYL